MNFEIEDLLVTAMGAVVGILAVGLLFYLAGGLPGIKQASAGFAGERLMGGS